ncbi:hypothetical protein [Cryobacterium tagatosivorans]|uniref:Uncharacterized protein n=1 Tax=Cryobacterium tagatosivorans TaxID=1259199 RepID=A0A4R8UDK2_9MICO|nr:hypothetical protein [Cryobacterium tagatosivorans]TFB50377.1 hypothetical protein E3O23_09520 [Cryobacterium tagatosivorans]
MVFADLLRWPTRRRLIAFGVAAAAFAAVTLASGLLGFDTASAGPWWAYAAVASGSGLIGLVVAGYFGAPIGAEATLCDTRWPVLGLIALYLATDARSLEPVLTGAVRPVVAVAALALLAWALRERLESEREATAAEPGEDGVACTTCRPLFPRPSATTGFRATPSMTSTPSTTPTPSTTESST